MTRCPLALSHAVGSTPISFTRTLKQGEGGYSSFHEVSVTNQYIASWNCNNGVTYADAPYGGQYNNIGSWIALFNSASLISRPLFRWDNLAASISANAIVQSASVQLKVQQWAMLGQCPVSVDVVTRAWSYNPLDVAGTCYRVGWTNSDK